MAALVRPEAGRSTAMGGGAEDGDGGAASARGEGTNKVSVRQGRGHAGALPTSLRAHRIPTTRRTCKSGGQHTHNARNRSGDKRGQAARVGAHAAPARAGGNTCATQTTREAQQKQQGHGVPHAQGPHLGAGEGSVGRGEGRGVGKCKGRSDGGAASARGEGTNKVTVRQGKGHAGALPTALRAHRIPTTL